MTKTIDEGAKWWEASGGKSWPYCKLYLARKEWAKTTPLPIGHFYMPPKMALWRYQGRTKFRKGRKSWWWLGWSKGI